MRRMLFLPALLAAGGVTLAGCTTTNPTSSESSSAGGPITVQAGDSACTVSTDTVEAGTLTFKVTNTGTDTTEFYLYATGNRIMGEVENVAPGLERRLIVEVPDAGTYTTACKPGMVGDGIRADFTVTGGAVRQVDTDTRLAEATAGYARYVQSQSGALVQKTTEFTAAVMAGNVDEAKALYPVARTYWERIEPVAETFGDLDPVTDGREDILEPGQEFTGWHRLERDLWQDGLQPDSAAMAEQLLANVKEVVDRSATVELTPLQLANGAKDLMDEVATGKITGEEDRYSHTDLWDFRANVDGSQAAIAALQPVLADRAPELQAKITTRFDAVEAALETYRRGDGFVLYTDLTPADVRTLSEKVDALAEPLSQVAAVVAGQ